MPTQSRVYVTESELYLTISKAINYDMGGTLSHRIENHIKELSQDEINELLEKFEIKDIEQFLRNKKLKNLSK